MSVWSIAVKDLQIFFKERGAILYLFLLPFLFIMMFAGLGATVTAGEEALIPLPIVNNDPGGQLSEQFVQALRDTGKVELVPLDQADAETQLSKLDIEYALFIPAGFTADLEAQRNTFFPAEEDKAADTAVTEPQVEITLLVHPNHSQTQVANLERVISKATRDISLQDYLNDSLVQFREMKAANPQAWEYLTEERIRDQVDGQVAVAEERPLVVVNETTPAGLRGEVQAEEIEMPVLGQVAVVGMSVLFVFLAAQHTAQSIYYEKRIGSFRRLMAAPMSKAALMSGKLLPNFILTLIQIIVLMVVGVFVIPLIGVPSLNLSQNPFGVVLASLVIALCSTSLGIFIAGLARTESQVSGFSNALLWLAGILGGSMIPVFLYPEGLDRVVRIIPHYWANQTLFDLIFRGATLPDVAPSLLVLLGFTALFFLIGIWRFEFD
jgi:ABC-2 type transport system permease protein